MEFRLAVESDLDAILELYKSNILANKDYNQEQKEVWASSVNNREMWLNKIKEQYFLLAYENNKILGFCSLGQRDYVEMMFVQKDEFGKGVASGLLQNIETVAKSNQITQLLADVSLSGRRFFEKRGFRVLRTNRNFRNGIYLKNYRMRKLLKETID